MTVFLFLYRVLRERMDRTVAEGDLYAIWEPDAVWSRFIEEQLKVTD